jgi:hypothetical protein
LTGEAIAAWKPKTASETPDIMEISEQEFLSQAQGRDGKHVERRKNQHAPGQHFVGFNDIQLVGGRHIYLRFQGVAVPPADRLQRIHSFLTLPGLAFRLPGGGLGIVNLTNAVKLTAYPGPAEVPTDAWVANEETDQAIIGRKGNE